MKAWLKDSRPLTDLEDMPEVEAQRRKRTHLEIRTSALAETLESLANQLPLCKPGRMPPKGEKPKG